MSHIKQVLDVHAKFGKDLKGGAGFEDARRSYWSDCLAHSDYSTPYHTAYILQTLAMTRNGDCLKQTVEGRGGMGDTVSYVGSDNSSS